MDASSLQEFNVEKAALLRAICPATVAFAAAPSRSFAASFGESTHTGGIVDAGVGSQHLRTGVCYFPVPTGAAPNTDYTPTIGQIFTLVALSGSGSAHLVGTRWQVDDIRAAAGEAAFKLACHKVT